MPEPDDNAEDADYFYEDSSMVFLREMLNEGEAKIYLSGIAVNLLTLRPEVCTVLHIRSKKWWEEQRYSLEERGSKKKFFRFNDEFMTFSSDKDVVSNIEFAESDEELLEEEALQASRMVPSGAAAFWLGVDVLREVMGLKARDAS